MRCVPRVRFTSLGERCSAEPVPPAVAVRHVAFVQALLCKSRFPTLLLREVLSFRTSSTSQTHV